MDRLRIAILDDYQQVVGSLACFERLSGHDVTVLHEPVLRGMTPEKLARAEVLFPLRERTRIDAAFLARMPRLRLISQSGPVPHIVLDACTRRGIVVSSGAAPRASGPSPAGRATAELTWGLILASTRQICAEAASLKQGTWQRTVGRTLHGRTLGILGYGQIGAQVASCGRAFGMRVLVAGSPASCERARADGLEPVTRESLFACSDVLSVHLSLSAETRHSIREQDLAGMKGDALFVNTARAELLVPGVLVSALRQGRPGSAAIDVFEKEPLWGADDPLLHMPQVLCTPHLGYVVREAYEASYARAIDQMEAFARGSPVDVCNPGVLGSCRGSGAGRFIAGC